MISWPRSSRSLSRHLQYRLRSLTSPQACIFFTRLLLPLLLLLLLPPSLCLQATSRIWRYGQVRPCFVYHLLYAGTVEQQLYDSTLAKQELLRE
jgi:hypothetical protein